MLATIFALAPIFLAPLAHLSGCFDVTYTYLEAEARPLQALAQREWIAADPADADGTVVVRHFRYQDGQPVPHFQEEWRPLAGGAWRQSVVGPDGTPRYACAARFSRNEWRCRVPSAPMPRRDAGRTDYAVIDREITLQLAAAGWAQSERNDKRDEGGRLIANELGWNVYARVDDGQCPR